MKSYLTWPECFQTGVVPNKRSNIQLCADALCAWGNCMSGLYEIPPCFGDVMVKIGNRLSITPLPENFSQYSEDWFTSNKKGMTK